MIACAQNIKVSDWYVNAQSEWDQKYVAVPDQPPKAFADYRQDGANWITLATGDFYPDILASAMSLYAPVLTLFGQLLKQSDSSTDLLIRISEVTPPWMRVQLGRVFRKYVSPATPVEMLKRKRDVLKICDQFGRSFRPIPQVQAAFDSRLMPDEALCAIMWEYKDRGQKGYALTERFFAAFRARFPDLLIDGPGLLLGSMWDDYARLEISWPGLILVLTLRMVPERLTREWLTS